MTSSTWRQARTIENLKADFCDKLHDIQVRHSWIDYHTFSDKLEYPRTNASFVLNAFTSVICMHLNLIIGSTIPEAQDRNASIIMDICDLLTIYIKAVKVFSSCKRDDFRVDSNCISWLRSHSITLNEKCNDVFLRQRRRPTVDQDTFSQKWKQFHVSTVQLKEARPELIRLDLLPAEANSLIDRIFE